MHQDEIIRSRIKFILVRVLNLEIEPSEIGNTELLFEGNLGIDSIVTIEIVCEIEEYFGIKITDEEIDLELFRSVNSLAEVVQRHLAQQSFPRALQPR